VFYCDLQQGMVMLGCLLGILLQCHKHQMMNHSIQEETMESDLAVPVDLRHRTVQGQFSPLIRLPGCDYLAPGTSPIGDGIFAKVIVPPQGRSRQPALSLWAMTIDQQIQRMVENRIRQQPGPYVLIILDEDVMYIR